MRKTEVFGIDIPELGDPSDITVVSDAIHDVENAMGCRIEFMNAVSTPGLISLNSKVRIHPYTTYYDDMSFAFIAPIDIPVGNSIAIKIDDLPQQPFNNEAFNGKGSLVFITYNTKTGFKSYENGSKIINDLTTGGANDALSAEMGKQLQNNKLDKGAVSTEYDTAKKIEDRIKDRVSKNGDTVNGRLNIDAKTEDSIGIYSNGVKKGDIGSISYAKAIGMHNIVSNSGIQINDNGVISFSTNNEIKANSQLSITASNNHVTINNSKGVAKGTLGYIDGSAHNYCYFYNTTSGNQLIMRDDGRTSLNASNLATPQKEVIDAINGIYTRNYPPLLSDDITTESFKQQSFWRNRECRFAYVSNAVLGIAPSTYITTWHLEALVGADTTTLFATDYQSGTTATGIITGENLWNGWFLNCVVVFVNNDGIVPYPQGFNKNNCYISAVAKPKTDGSIEFFDDIYRRGSSVSSRGIIALVDSGISIQDFTRALLQYNFAQGLFVYLQRRELWNYSM